MTKRILKLLNEQYPLEQKAVEREYAEMKVSGMKFQVSSFCVKGLGHVSEMIASGMMGLMKMDTLVIVPTEKDLPLFSYDRIYAMGNDKCCLEFFDTTMNGFDHDPLFKINTKIEGIEPFDAGKHWYDDIRVKENIYLKTKKKNGDKVDGIVKETVETFLSLAEKAEIAPLEKVEKDCAYVNGLLEQGGPSTDVFLKKFGKEKTAKFFHQYLFGV